MLKISYLPSDFQFPDGRGKWHHLHINKYRDTFYNTHVNGDGGRMVETMRMFLAIHEAGLPVSIVNPEGVRKRLLAQDNIEICLTSCTTMICAGSNDG